MMSIARATGRSSVPSRAAALVAALAMLAVAPSIVPAQVVRGTVSARGTHERLANSVVALLDSASRAVATALADDRGAFTLAAPAAGRYSLRVERVGFRSAREGPYTLATGDTLRLALDVASESVSLAAVRVTADRRCVVHPQEGAAAATIWDEARKALTATQLGQMAQAAMRARQGVSSAMRIRRTRRELDPVALRELSRSVTESETDQLRTFESVDPERLARDGYVRPDPDGGATYYAPDAAVLLSDRFLDTHCFRVREHATSGASDLIGLAFEPAHVPSAGESAGTRVDVAGVLWLDRNTAELRYMEYRYANLQVDAPLENIGGFEEFRAMPDGRWVVWRWYIRMPRIARTLTLGATGGSFERRTLQSITEEGGEVLDLLAQTRARTMGRIVGTVVDSTRSGVRSLAGSRVFLSGTSFTATADSVGRFVIDSVPPGLYQASVLAPRFDSLLLVPPSRELPVSAGDETRADFAVPSMRSFRAAMCGQRGADEESSMVIGVARDTADAAANGATVSARWTVIDASGSRVTGQHTVSRIATVGGSGRFAICGVPADSRVLLRARLGTIEAEDTVLPLERGEVRRIDLHLRPRR